MKGIRLVKLVLKDFQGGNFTLSANGKDVYCYGENASGKTRLVSGWSWLLFGKDSLGRSDFSIKNIGATGEPEHNLQHSVEAILDVDGEQITLKKTLSEVWQKKRGSSQATFTGHTNEFYIDGVPTQKKLFDEKVAEVAGQEDTFRLLTSPTVFPALPWQRQRSLLMDVVGDLSDADVISSNDKLSSLSAILGKRTIDDMRKIITVRRSEINKELPSITVRIDEVRRGIPDVSGLDLNQCKKQVSDLESAVNDAKLKLRGIDSGSGIAELSKKLAGFNADLRKMEDAHRSGSLFTLNRLNQQISEVEVIVNASRKRITGIDGDLKWKDGGLQTLENIDLPKLREKWMAIDGLTFKDTTANTCPACNQPLPADQVSAAREKALASFNESKAERLGEVDRKGQSLKEQRDKLKTEIGALREERSKIEADLPSLESDLAKAKNDRDALKQSSEDFSGIPNRADLLDEIEDLETQIKAEREGKTQDVEKIKGEISALQTVLFAAKDKVDMFTRREQGERRIEELKTEEKKLAAEFEKLEGELYLIEAFIRTKVSMLTTRINEKFETVRFKLFDQQVNGALAECCQITVGGVPFDSGLNNGARINAGLEIVKVLQQHYNLRAPVFADNAEAVNKLVEVGCQMIRLYVSEDNQLRVEFTEGVRHAKAA